MGDYRPYETSAFRHLMQICYNMGWYSGVRTLFTVKMIGQFEGHGRTSETWEHDFEVELPVVSAHASQEVVDVIYYGCPKAPTLDDYERSQSLPGGIYRGRTLEEACQKALDAIRAWRQE